MCYPHYSKHACQLSDMWHFLFRETKKKSRNFVTRLTGFLGRELFRFLKYYVDL
jgi:hypothetical protein